MVKWSIFGSPQNKLLQFNAVYGYVRKKIKNEVGLNYPSSRLGICQWRLSSMRPAANYRPNNDLTMQSKGEEKTKGSKVLNDFSGFQNGF